MSYLEVIDMDRIVVEEGGVRVEYVEENGTRTEIKRSWAEDGIPIPLPLFSTHTGMRGSGRCIRLPAPSWGISTPVRIWRCEWRAIDGMSRTSASPVLCSVLNVSRHPLSKGARGPAPIKSEQARFYFWTIIPKMLYCFRYLGLLKFSHAS